MDNKTEKLYRGMLNPNEEILALTDENGGRELYKKIEELSKKLKHSYDEKLFEQYNELQIKLQDIIAMNSFTYGMKLGIQLSKDL